MNRFFSTASPEVRQYLLITGNYWAFTLSDGALRMLVVLYFYQLGYSPLAIAMLFLFYEIFGVATNLVGGWLAARWGLNRTMNLGLALQVMALAMLLVPIGVLTIPWVMAAQALSGIAKDLNKMSAKSAIKLLVPREAQSALFRWVALLTGSKNALKGVGFFLGGALLGALGFRGAVLMMGLVLAVLWVLSLFTLGDGLGRATNKPKFTHLFSQDAAINVLAAARLFLFGARDIWFVVALPVFLAAELGWSHKAVGGFLALWIIAYGVVQSLSPKIIGRGGKAPDGTVALRWVLALAVLQAITALGLTLGFDPQAVLVLGLLLFGVFFAMNSAVHSYLIVSYAREDGVSMDVGFYYMANALGRLMGTVLSGWVFQVYGLAACLWASTVLVAVAALFSTKLPR